jgi:predicted nucleic acid-binding protein
LAYSAGNQWSGVAADTSVWVDFFAGRPVSGLEDALRQGLVVFPPIVVAELISGARRPRDRAAILDLVEDLPMHETPTERWAPVGDLRRKLARQGVSISTPDAHVAQCAHERDALLLSGDAIFVRVAETSNLRVQTG